MLQRHGSDMTHTPHAGLLRPAAWRLLEIYDTYSHTGFFGMHYIAPIIREVLDLLDLLVETLQHRKNPIIKPNTTNPILPAR